MRRKERTTGRDVGMAFDDGVQSDEPSEMLMPTKSIDESKTKTKKNTNSILVRNREKQKSKGTAIDARCVLPVNVKEYFVERDGDAFRSLFAKTLKLGTLTFDDDGPESVLQFEEEGRGNEKEKTTVVRLVTRPDLGSWVPASVRHAVSTAAEIEFHDDIEYGSVEMEKPPFCLYVRTRSPFLGSKFSLESRLTFSRLEDGRCEQRLQGRVQVKMLGLGGLVERMVRDSVQNTYKKLPHVIGLWNEERRRILVRDEGNGSGLVRGRPEHIDCGVEWIREVVERMKSGIGPFAVDDTDEQKAVDGGEQQMGKMLDDDDDDDACAARAAKGPDETKRFPMRKLSSLVHMMWIEFVDICRAMCLVFIVVLLRLGLLTGGRRPPVERPIERRRHLAAWSTVAKVRHHRRECSAPDLPDVEEIIRATHVRRVSTDMASDLYGS